jgi:hypothetical protein
MKFTIKNSQAHPWIHTFFRRKLDPKKITRVYNSNTATDYEVPGDQYYHIFKELVTDPYLFIV